MAIKNYKSPYGGDDEAQKTINTVFNVSEEQKKLQTNAENNYNKYQTHTESDMVSSKTNNAMNKSFKTPNTVTAADAWLSNQLKVIQSGKTSYSDQVKDMMDKIMNREKFSYDVDNDQLFQQALASAMKSGKTAMQDTIGQASALTGGYGSTYATTAGNQAYNAFVEDAYNNLPQYYQMELNAYQMEGEDMYRQYGMLSDADDKEFNRNVAAYDATFQYRNNAYNEAYTKYRDDKSDAFAMANLEMQQYSQKSSDLYNLYGISADLADKQYEREYQKWSDDINVALKMQEMYNSDAWATKNFDESVRQYEKNFAEQQRQHNEQMSYNWASLNQRSSGGSGGGKTISSSIPDSIEKETKNAKNNDARKKYVADLVEKGYLTNEQGAYLLDTYNQADLKDRTWEVKSKGGLNWGGGIDKNAKVTDQYDNEYKMSELFEEASKTMGEDEAKKWIIQLQKDLGISQRN